MKNIYFPTLMMVSALFFMTACYEDLSTEADHVIPEIVITADVDEIINVSYGEDFTFKPEVRQEGRTPEDFTYLWEIDLTPGRTTNRIELGTELELKYKIGNNPSDKPYILSLIATDKETGLSAIRYWKLYISSSLGEGILVAHTRDGGKTSELDLVSDKSITYGFTGEESRYVRNLYEFANKETYQGRINTMTCNVSSSGSSFNDRALFIGGDEGFYGLDLLTYKVSRRDKELFYLTDETTFNVSAVFNYANYVSACLVNNRLYNMICNSGNAYTKTKFGKDPEDVFFENTLAYSKGEQGSICNYDKVHDGIFWTKGWMSGSGGLAELNEKPVSFSIKDSDVLGGGSLKDLILAYVVKRNTGGYCLYTMDFNPLTPITAEYELSAPELDKAVSIEFCENCNVFYYTTDQHIYSNTIIGNEVNTRKLNWEPDSPDEKITDIVHYQQAWFGTHQYGNNYDFALPMHQLMMLVVTYNEKTGEGKIYPRMFNVTTGLFTFKKMEPYTGFGEITALATTFR